MKGFIEIKPGLWYEESTGLPWSTRVQRSGATNGKLKQLTYRNSNGYYIAVIKGTKQRWHRLVFEYFNGPIPDGMEIDHINNKRDDNRIENLQLLSHKENCRCSLKNSNNTSGKPGVSWDKANKKWRASIKVNGKRKHLGRFTDKESAYQAYLKEKIKYHGQESIRSL